VPTLRPFSRWFNLRRTVAVATAALAPPLQPATAMAEPELRLITMVVNITVPAGAFNPSTGRAEVTLPRGLVLQVKDENSWKLRMRASRATFVTQTVPANTKPLSDLQLRHATGGSLLVPAVSFIEIAKGGNTHGWSELAFDVIFQATSDDASGLYSVNLEFDFH
jgi:hypothetical protein